MRKGPFEAILSGRKLKTSHAQVVDEIGAAIVSGEYPIGSILPGDQELAQRFRVSRTVLREAMKTLAAKGMIVPRARIGTKVTPKHQWNMFDSDVLTWHFNRGVDSTFLDHLSDIRLAFEPYAASLAARNASAEDIDTLRRLADEMGNPAHSAESLALADLKFHLAVAEASRNPFMRTVGNLIEAALVGMFTMSSPNTGENRSAEVSCSHRKIADAIAAHSEERAGVAMREVILSGRERVRSLLAKSA